MPIKDKAHIEAMFQVLRQQSERDFLLLNFAIHTGVRLSTLLNLRVEDILDITYRRHLDTSTELTSPIIIREWSNAHLPEIIVPLPESLRTALSDYISHENCSLQAFLFQSSRTKQQLSRQQAYRIIHQAAESINLPHIGLQSLRKTFAYQAYQAGTPLTVIQKYLGHQSLNETIKFIDITDEQRTIEIRLDF